MGHKEDVNCMLIIDLFIHITAERNDDILLASKTYCYKYISKAGIGLE
ncbi:MAG: hypothetical protein ABJB76_04860 [Candidatus Nitrosocosmicus sp.]